MSSPPQNRSAIAETLGADRELALIHVPTVVREAFRALFSIDSAMADVVARSTDPALGRIKLAWWRERLEELDRAAAPAEPRLGAVAEHLLPIGVKGADLAERGAALFRIGGKLLASANAKLADAGRLYSLASVGRRGVPELFEPARQYLVRLREHRFERSVRPLTMLARAAARDLSTDEPEGSRARALAMLAHRWSGRIG